jgi:hypothetical protein
MTQKLPKLSTPHPKATSKDDNGISIKCNNKNLSMNIVEGFDSAVGIIYVTSIYIIY